MTHDDFHTMPSMSRRAFLAGLIALPAAAAVPGLEKVSDPSQTCVYTQSHFLDMVLEARRILDANDVPSTATFYVAEWHNLTFTERLPA